MPNPEENINQYLKSMGFSTSLAPAEGMPNVRFAVVSHMGVNMAIVLDGPFVYPTVNLGYVPKMNVAPLLRRMLNLNAVMGGPQFFVREDDSIGMQVARQVEGLDFVEFKSMLDSLGAAYWQNGAGLVQQFQIPAQPS
jgi:hypothetical protein